MLSPLFRCFFVKGKIKKKGNDRLSQILIISLQPDVVDLIFQNYQFSLIKMSKFEISNVYTISCFKDIEIKKLKFVPSNQLLFRIIIQINFTFIRKFNKNDFTKKNCIWTALGHTQNIFFNAVVINFYWYHP